MNCSYCNIHIDKHEALRCLRGWICRDFMGWEVWDGKDGLPAHVITDLGDHIYLLPDLGPVWYPDLDILAAWEVWKKLGDDDYTKLVWFNYDGRESYWRFTHRGLKIEAIADTAPLAICRAAIKVCNA